MAVREDMISINEILEHVPRLMKRGRLDGNFLARCLDPDTSAGPASSSGPNTIAGPPAASAVQPVAPAAPPSPAGDFVTKIE